jgi:hypothetical protein
MLNAIEVQMPGVRKQKSDWHICPNENFPNKTFIQKGHLSA